MDVISRWHAGELSRAMIVGDSLNVFRRVFTYLNGRSIRHHQTQQVGVRDTPGLVIVNIDSEIHVLYNRTMKTTMLSKLKTIFNFFPRDLLSGSGFMYRILR